MKNCSSLQIKAENKISSHASKAFRVRFASRCEGARFGIQEVARQRNRRGSPLSLRTLKFLLGTILGPIRTITNHF